MTVPRRLIGFLNLAHALDHMFMLIFPMAVLGMTATFDRPYAELLPLSLGGFIAFGAGALPAGWLGDRWRRHKMVVVFFIGTGRASIVVGMARTMTEIAVALTVLGGFAAIYHPVASAMLVADPARVGRTLGINGLFGNLGIAFSALAAGTLTDLISWRAAFIVPGLAAIASGIAYLALVRDPGAMPEPTASGASGASDVGGTIDRALMFRVFLILVLTISCGGVIFNTTTIAIPKVFDERLGDFIATPLGIGALSAAVYVIAAFAQVCVGPLIDRLEIRNVFIPVVGLQVPLLFLAGYTDGWPMMLVAVLMMLVVFGQVPVNDAIIARCTADAYRARAYAVRYFVSFGASAVAVPLIAFLRAYTGGFQQVFEVLAALAICMLAAALGFPRLRGKILDRASSRSR